MGLGAFWFWFVLVLLFEIFFAKYAAYALGLVLGLILSLAGFLFSCEFDLLAAMVSLTYGSVFILLSLLLMQFSSLGGLAQRGSAQVPSFFWLFFLVIFFYFCFPWASSSAVTAWTLSILWQDLMGLGGAEFCQAGLIAHELLFRLFVLETVWANVFLALAFVVYALLLKSRTLSFLPQVLQGGLFLLQNTHWRKKWTSFQARAIHHPKRQVRRQASSILRHRV